MLALVAAALAGNLVVYEGTDAAKAAALVSSLGGTDLDVASFASVAAEAAPVVRGAKPRSCTGTPPDLGTALRVANGHLLYNESPAAIAVLDTAITGLPCLVEPADAGNLGRLWQLRAYATWMDTKSADAGFRQWLSVDPSAAWDKRLAAAAGAAADALRPALAATARIPLTFQPLPEGAWLDGKVIAPTGAEMLPGEHLLQIAGRPSMMLTVTDGAVTIIDPARAGADALATIAEADGPARHYLAALPRRPGWVVVGDAAYRDAGAGLERVLPALPEPSPLVPLTRWGGAGLALVGGALIGIGLAENEAAVAAVDLYDRDSYDTNLARSQTAGGLYAAGWVAAGLGAASVAASFFLPVSAVPLHDGGILAVHGTLP